MSAAQRRRPTRRGGHFRAIRTCDEVLAALAAFPEQDEAIVLLQLAIVAEREQAVRGASVEALPQSDPGRRTGT